MDHVVMVPVYVRQESQVCREILARQDQQALLAHPARKDPRDHVETKATQGNQEVKACRAPRDHEDLKVTPAIREVRALQAPKDLKGPRAKRAHEEPKVTQATKEVKARRAFQARWEVTGNNAFGKISTTARILD